MSEFSQAYLAAKSEEQNKVMLYLDHVDINDGYLHDAVLFSQIMYWHLPNKKKLSKLRVMYEGEYWISKHHDDWYAECRIKAPMVRKALKRIEARSLIHYAVTGFAGKKTPLIRINWRGFQIAIQKQLSLQYDTLYQDNMIHCIKPNTVTTSTVTTKEKDIAAPQADGAVSLPICNECKKPITADGWIVDGFEELAICGKCYADKDVKDGYIVDEMPTSSGDVPALDDGSNGSIIINVGKQVGWAQIVPDGKCAVCTEYITWQHDDENFAMDNPDNVTHICNNCDKWMQSLEREQTDIDWLEEHVPCTTQSCDDDEHCHYCGEVEQICECDSTHCGYTGHDNEPLMQCGDCCGFGMCHTAQSGDGSVVGDCGDHHAKGECPDYDSKSCGDGCECAVTEQLTAEQAGLLEAMLKSGGLPTMTHWDMANKSTLMHLKNGLGYADIDYKQTPAIWHITDTGRAALKHYQAQQKDGAIDGQLQCARCQYWFDVDKITGHGSEMLCNQQCYSIVVEQECSEPERYESQPITLDEALTIADDSRKKIEQGIKQEAKDAAIGALCEVVEDVPQQMCVTCGEPIAHMRYAIPVDGCYHHTSCWQEGKNDNKPQQTDIDDPLPKAKPKAKKVTPHTAMKNALVAAMGFAQEDVTCWGDYNSASKKLRAAKFPVEDVPTLHGFSCGLAKQGNYKFKSPMQLAKDLPEYRKEQRLMGIKAQQTPTGEPQPLNADDVVTYSEDIS